jgi:hypothetical protein
MHTGRRLHESGLGAAKQLHRLRDLIQQGDAEGFASELNLDPRRTRHWFDQEFTGEGYGADVITALGTLVLSRIVVDSKHR